jgi:hypothetical protein
MSTNQRYLLWNKNGRYGARVMASKMPRSVELVSVQSNDLFTFDVTFVYLTISYRRMVDLWQLYADAGIGNTAALPMLSDKSIQ